MKKIFSLLLLSFAAMAPAFSQIIAGSGASGQIISDPNVNLSVSSIGSTAIGMFDLDCDSMADMRVELYKGPTAVDGPNTAYLYVMNPDFRLCTDTGSFAIAPSHFYSLGDTLNCTGSYGWINDTIYELGNYGCMGCMGPYSISSKYLSYYNTATSQYGWIRITFDLTDGGSSGPVTLTIPEILSPCSSTAITVPSGGSGSGTCGIFSYNYTITPPICGGDCNGSIYITGLTGGTPAYTYSWSDGSNLSYINSACAGAYSVVISDAMGNSCTAYFSVPSPTPMTFSLVTNNISCYGACDGVACIGSLFGGTAPYTYTWAPSGVTSSCMAGACAGTYYVCVTDANGCAVCTTFTLVEPPMLQSTKTSTNESCFGCCDGVAEVIASGGTAGYMYDWTPGNPTGDGTSIISNLCSSSYTCCITDMNGCYTCDTVEVSFPSAIQDNLNEDSFSIYPNPSKGSFRIGFPDSRMYSVQLLNTIGDVVYEGRLNEKDLELNTDLAEGIYFLRISESGSGKTINRKIIISK